MKKMSRGCQTVAFLSLLAIAAGSFQAVATAVTATGTPKSPQEARSTSPQQGNSPQIAQTTANLCRKVNVQQGLLVREKPAPNSRQVGGVGFNSQITLAQAGNAVKGPDGRLWMEIGAPVKGYISSGFPNRQTNLAMCAGTVSAAPQNTSAATKTASETGSGTTSDTGKANLCRQVDPRVKQGIVIRADASSTSASQGGVPVNGKITLIENYKLVPDKNGDNREWVQVTGPVAGFVATNNLIMCR